MLSKLLIFIFLAVSVFGQQPEKKDSLGVSGLSALATFDSRGKPFAKATSRSRVPKIIVDTITFSGQYVSIRLNSSFTAGTHAVSGSSNKTVYVTVTPQLADSSDNLYYYGTTIVDKGRRIIIKSSNANDSTKVVFMAIIK